MHDGLWLDENVQCNSVFSLSQMIICEWLHDSVKVIYIYCWWLNVKLELWAGKSIPLWIDKLDRGAMQISTPEGNGSCQGSRMLALLWPKPAATLVALRRGSTSANSQHMGQGWCNQGQWCGTGIPNRKWQNWWCICSLPVAPQFEVAPCHSWGTWFQILHRGKINPSLESPIPL